MTRLYIIGNGFDLRHELPTGYENFYDHSKDVLEDLESYYMLDTTDRAEWRDFESALGTYDWQLMYDEHNHVNVRSESFKRSDMYGLEDELSEQTDLLVTKIEEQFRNWVDSIDVATATKKFNFPVDARFLSFNYTSTLQAVYSIESSRVLHIHGRATTHDQLVFGHGNTMEDVPEREPNGDSNRTIFTDPENAAKYPFHALKKPIEDVLKRHQVFFRDLSDITTAVVIGHSLSDVDLPYFRELASSNADWKWIVYCHDLSQSSNYVSQLLKCGIDRTQIVICGYDSRLERV